MKVYDILGNEVTALMNQNLSPGSYQVKWNGEGFASGVYFYELSVTGLSAKFKETNPKSEIPNSKFVTGLNGLG